MSLINSLKHKRKKANLEPYWHEPIVYRRENYKTLRYKFNNAEKIEKNYSQSFQDLFVLMVLNGKSNGTWLEIGCGDPINGNNTKLLEEFNWEGLSIDLNEAQEERWRIRKTIPVICDATKIKWEDLEILKQYSVIDYLQIDIDPANVSYSVLTSIPFNRNKFRVITFEHDFYTRNFDDIRVKSRDYLMSLGYKLLVSNISPNYDTPFEDWWIHPNLVDKKIITELESCKEINYCEDWVYNR